MKRPHGQSSLKPAIVASLALASTLLLSGCASSGGAQKKALSDEDARYVTKGTYKPKSAQEAASSPKRVQVPPEIFSAALLWKG